MRLIKGDLVTPPEKWLSNYNDLVRYYLWDAGVTNAAMAEKWLDLDEQSLCDPMWMKDIDNSMSILDSVSSVLVWGDYDVDGLTSTSIMEHGLLRCGFDVITHVPSRSDGYGITVNNLISVLEKCNVDCIVTVDCGIRSREVAAWLKTNHPSIRYIVTDHHDVEETELPIDADAIVNPKQIDCCYPNPDLSGAGVAYKFVDALHSHTNTHMNAGDKSYYVALACLGIVADMMTITHLEQRFIVREGLSALSISAPEGVVALLKAMRHPHYEAITPVTIGFVIAPPLNAASRMGDVNLAYSLLRSPIAQKEPVDYGELATKLVSLNNKRKKVQRSVSNEVISSIRESYDNVPPIVITVVPSSDAPEGLMGLIASNLNDAFHRPAIALTEKIENGVSYYGGSARSIDGYDITDAISQAENHLVRYGGHEGAAGLKMLKENYDAFVDAMILHAGENAPDPDSVAPSGSVVIPLSLVTWNTYNVLFALQPFTGDSSPVFESTCVVGDVTPIGARGGIRTVFVDPVSGFVANGVCFTANYARMPAPGDTAIVTYKLRHDTFAGANSIVMDMLWVRIDNNINLATGEHFEDVNTDSVRKFLGSGNRRRV